MDTSGQAFLSISRRYFRQEYLPKIRLCLRDLSPDDLWWRPTDTSNSVGNLLLHLAGNLRQWVVAGIGREADVRDRPAEFAREGGVTAKEALATLTAAVDDADRVLGTLRPEQLLERRTIQGHDVTVQEAIYHVVEHFSMHTGQILWITKARTGVDLRFYASEGNLARPQWLERDADA